MPTAISRACSGGRRGGYDWLGAGSDASLQVTDLVRPGARFVTAHVVDTEQARGALTLVHARAALGHRRGGRGRGTGWGHRRRVGRGTGRGIGWSHCRGVGRGRGSSTGWGHCRGIGRGRGYIGHAHALHVPSPGTNLQGSVLTWDAALSRETNTFTLWIISLIAGRAVHAGTDRVPSPWNVPPCALQSGARV